MEERKTIFNYIGQIFMIFGFTIFTMCIMCIFVGEDAKAFSTIFQLGKKGLAAFTILQYLLLSIIIVFLRFIFSTDVIIKKASSLIRTIGMLLSVILSIIIFIYVCDWFPVTMWQPWVGFFICFGICFAVSTFIMKKEQMENVKLEEALQRLLKEDANELHD